MSDLLIKCMEMPKGCAFCKIKQRNGKKMICPLCDEEWDIRYPTSADHRLENCPLVEVPPHGRLGDLDKLEKMFADIDSAPYSCFDGAEPFYSAEDAVHIIRLAPTIIPAAEAKEAK